MYIRARFMLLYNMYVELCLYVWPSQPGKVTNPTRGQELNRENKLFAVLVRA